VTAWRRLRARACRSSDDAFVSASADFFVSYTSADRPWAEWIAWELEHVGHNVIVQAWDFAPGANFVLATHEAARVAKRTIAVLSPAFLESPYAASEWAAAFRDDPSGKDRKLVPVRVRDCDPGGLLGSVAYVDVVGLSEAESRAALLAVVTESRAKPAAAPAFPGSGVAERSERVRRPETGAAIFNVPISTRTFVGRTQQLNHLAAGFVDANAAAVMQVYAIHGMGGVGKTQLAARYARVHRDAYDVIWWLRAEEPQTLRSDLAALAAVLGLVDAADVDEQTALTAAEDWLERNGRWLLVFDNATGPEAIAGLLPEGSGGHVLITSRVHADWRALHAQPLALDVWAREESRAFLSERTGEQDVGVVDAVADAVGDLPLALEQAAAYTNTKAITLAGFAERLRDRAPELFSAQPMGSEHSVSTVWQLAFEQIAAHPIANHLLRVCAHLAPDRIPRELLEAWANLPDAPEDAQQRVDEAIELLLAYALLTSSEEGTLNVHRLIQEGVRTRASPDARQQGAASAVAILEQVFPDHPWETDHWPSCERLLSHGIVATNHAQALRTAPALTARVLGRMGQYQYARAELGSARDLLESALALKESVYGGDHAEVARTLGTLGVVHEWLGDLPAALETQERALAIYEGLYGLGHVEVAHTLTNLGNVMGRRGDLQGARMAQERALAILERAYGPEHPEIAMTLGSLGNALLQLGDLPAARATLERTLAIFSAAYGPEHPQVARTLSNLGNALIELEDLPAARVALERAVAIKENVFGPEHPEVARSLTNLGIVLLNLEDLPEALSSLERALAILERVYGSEHPELYTTLSNLGRLLLEMGDLQYARTYLERALAIFEAVYGSEHADLAATSGNLGIVLAYLGDLPAARTAQERALAIEERVYGPEHPEIARTLTNLGMVLWKLGDQPAARATLERARLIKTRTELGLDEEQREEVTAALYIASGGNSALLRTASGWSVRVEAHTGSFAFVWPATASLTDVLALLGDPGADPEVLLGTREAPPQELSWSDAIAALQSSDGLFDFARFDLERLTLTWTRTRRQLPSGPQGQVAHEVGLGIEAFDERMLLELIQGSGVESVVQSASALVRRARTVLFDVPTGNVSG
jgi:tetratricopeptide (TPR) repeat protein